MTCCLLFQVLQPVSPMLRRAGTIQESWASLPSFIEGLTALNLSANMLKASRLQQTWHGTKRHLTMLWQQGSLPGNWSSFAALTAMDMSTNQLTGL